MLSGKAGKCENVLPACACAAFMAGMMIKTVTDQAIQDAASLIQDGQVVAFPTETVYGLGANALDGQAVARIFEAKQRPAFNPLIVHVTDFTEAQKLGVFNEHARRAAKAFWPGPLTIIVPRAEDCPVNELATAGLDTIAVRVPSHKTARALIKAAGVPLAAPSANASGEPSATTPNHVADSLGDRISMILADGACAVGLESTVLDCSGEKPVILRHGAVTAEDLEPIIGHVVIETQARDNHAPKSPGQILRHYAPSVPVRLNAVDVAPGEALLAFGSVKFMGIKGGGAASDLPDTMLKNLSESGDLTEAAANLFAMLRDLDKPEHKKIAVMNVPETGIGIAMNDRLKRAAEK